MISPSGKCFFVLCNRFNDLFHVVFGTTPIDHPNVRIDCKYGVAKWWGLFKEILFDIKAHIDLLLLHHLHTIQLFSTSEFHHFLGMTPLFPHTAAAQHIIQTKYYTSVEYRTQKIQTSNSQILTELWTSWRSFFFDKDGTLMDLEHKNSKHHEIFENGPNLISSSSKSRNLSGFIPTLVHISSSSRYPCTLKELTLSKQWFTTANCL